MNFEHFLRNVDLLGSRCFSEERNAIYMGQYIFFSFLKVFKGVSLVVLRCIHLGTLAVTKSTILCNECTSCLLPVKLLGCIFFFSLLVSPNGIKENDFLCILVTFLPHGLITKKI